MHLNEKIPILVVDIHEALPGVVLWNVMNHCEGDFFNSNGQCWLIHDTGQLEE